MDDQAGRLRQGRKEPQNLYLQAGDAPADTDQTVGWATTPGHAAVAVAAVNDAVRVTAAHWWHHGHLVYDTPQPPLSYDWVIAVRSEELAAHIASAARGDQS